MKFPVLLDIFVQDKDGRLRFVECISLSRPGTYAIGRLEENAIMLSAPQVSRRHAELIASEEALQIVDRDSKFGTFVGTDR